MKTILFLLVLIPYFMQSQTDTDIYLYDLKVNGNEITLSNPKNITNKRGYDNQPSFSPDGKSIYFSSFDKDKRSDIWAYHLQSGKKEQISHTKVREYSPTPVPGGEYLSFIAQYEDGKQNLERIHLLGGQREVLVDDLTVGYHTWIDNENLLLFVLGEPRHFLYHYNVKTKKNQIIANNIGRALHRIPNSNSLSFIKKIDSEHWQIRQFNNRTKGMSTIANTLKGREDLAWTNNGIILMGDGNKIFALDTKLDSGKWKEIKIFGNQDFLKNISRIAINKDNSKLAVVVAE